MPVAELVLCAVCAVSVGIAVLSVGHLRPRLSKHSGATMTFAMPGALLALPAAWCATHGEILALVPLASIAALCFAAAAVFAPTSATRFAAFEREFWAHVDRVA
jgi:hypothetical protein